jgi:hypothetical protein
VWQKCLFVCVLFCRRFSNLSMIHNSNCTGWIGGPRVAAATAHTVCMPCVCRVSELALALSLCAGISGNNGSARRAQRERESAHLPSPSIHPSVRPQAATQTERPWPMAHTTLFVRAEYFSSTQRERVHKRTQKKRERTHSLTLALPVCFFARRKRCTRIIYIYALVFAAMSHELIY